MPSNFRSSRTMQLFLNNTMPFGAVQGTSTLALRAQAVALFDRATYLSSIWSPSTWQHLSLQSHTNVRSLRFFPRSLCIE